MHVAFAALFYLPFAAFFLGGLAGARRPTAGATAKAACRAAGEALAGWVGCFVLFAVYVAALVF